MSYNLMSGSIEFVGEQLGFAENLVNTHAQQLIHGAKTFYNITASAEGDGTHALHAAGNISVAGDIELTEGIVHHGDTDTKIYLDNNEVSIDAGGNLGLNVTDSHVAINGDGAPRDQNIDFVVYSRDTNNGLRYDANTRAFQIGWIGNPSFVRSDVLLSVSSSYHTGSLFSIGHGRRPVFAVSGSQDYDVQSPRVLITGSLLVGGRHGSTQETAYAGGNIIAEGVITGSSGLRGELLSAGMGLRNAAESGEKKLQVEASTGISVTNNGVSVDVDSLTDVGSVNTSTSNQDFICVSDYSNSDSTRKMGVGDLLAQTVGSAAHVGGGDGQVYKATVSRELKFRTIAAGSNITVTNNANDITIAGTAAGAISTYSDASPGRLIVGGVNSVSVAGDTNLLMNPTRLMITGALDTSGVVTSGGGFVGSGAGLTSLPAGGANAEIMYNRSGSFEGAGTYTMISRATPSETEVYLTGTMHTQNLEVNANTSLYNTTVTHLTASNTVFTGAYRRACSLATSDRVLSAVDSVVIFNTSNNVTATLPPIVTSNLGQVFTIKNLNSGEVHVTGSASGGGAAEQFIDGKQYLVLSGALLGDGPYLTVVSAGVEGVSYDWYVIGKQLSSTP